MVVLVTVITRKQLGKSYLCFQWDKMTELVILVLGADFKLAAKSI